MDEQREFIGAALLYLSYGVNDIAETHHLVEARDLVIWAKNYYKTFKSGDYDDT